MSLRLVPLALLLGTCSALAFDTSKLGQWGSLFLDDLAPVTAKSSRLQQEINKVLSNANKKEEDVTCFGMRFPGQWRNLGGLRVSPYICDFGAMWLQIHATVRITDRRGQVFETITDKAMNNATTVSETNLNWKWTTERPALNFKNSVSALAASASTSLVWTTSSWLRNRVSLEQFQERMSYGLFVSELVEGP